MSKANEKMQKTFRSFKWILFAIFCITNGVDAYNTVSGQSEEYLQGDWSKINEHTDLLRWLGRYFGPIGFSTGFLFNPAIQAFLIIGNPDTLFISLTHCLMLINQIIFSIVAGCSWVNFIKSQKAISLACQFFFMGRGFLNVYNAQKITLMFLGGSAAFRVQLKILQKKPEKNKKNIKKITKIVEILDKYVWYIVFPISLLTLGWTLYTVYERYQNRQKLIEIDKNHPARGTENSILNKTWGETIRQDGQTFEI